MLEQGMPGHGRVGNGSREQGKAVNPLQTSLTTAVCTGMIILSWSALQSNATTMQLMFTGNML